MSFLYTLDRIFSGIGILSIVYLGYRYLIHPYTKKGGNTQAQAELIIL